MYNESKLKKPSPFDNPRLSFPVEPRAARPFVVFVEERGISRSPGNRFRVAGSLPQTTIPFAKTEEVFFCVHDRAAEAAEGAVSLSNRQDGGRHI